MEKKMRQKRKEKKARCVRSLPGSLSAYCQNSECGQKVDCFW
jgi:hypothetical protein